MPAKSTKGREPAVKKTKGGKVEKTKPEKEKKVKDPNAPRRGCGAYMWFCKEHRDVVKKEHPDLKVTEIGKRLGELWHEMTDSEKQKFFDLAEQDKQRYLREMAAYQLEKEEPKKEPKKEHKKEEEKDEEEEEEEDESE